MEPLIVDGSTVEVSTPIAELARDDVVTIKIGSAQTVIKRIAAIPGDRIALHDNKDGSSAILVNNAIALNSEGSPYAIGERGGRMLALYVADFQGVVPSNAYLVLGDNPRGTRDSTAFGLIDRSDIVGRVVAVDPPPIIGAEREPGRR